MKKLFLGLAVVSLLFVFVACDSNPGSGSGSGGSTSSIVGTWKGETTYPLVTDPGYVKYLYFSFTATESSFTFVASAKDINGASIEGSGLGTYAGTLTGSGASEGTYTIETYEGANLPEPVQRSWAISNGKLNVYMSDMDVPLLVKSAT